MGETICPHTHDDGRRGFCTCRSRRETHVTLWFGCPWTLAVYVAQLGGLALSVVGLWYVVLSRTGAVTSLTGSERAAPTVCAAQGIWVRRPRS